MMSLHKRIRRIAGWLLLAVALPAAGAGLPADELIATATTAGGEVVPYILNAANSQPKFITILFPGGNGQMNPRLDDERVVYGFGGNFLIRGREFIVDDEFATVATNTTSDESRVQALLDDLKRRYPNAQIYLMGTSRGTIATVKLAAFLADRIAGVIHTSSMGSSIYSFNAKEFRNRQLIVHHRNDQCKVTRYNSAEHAHEAYGTELITMEGGISEGDPCEAYAHHGYRGIERETMEAIKQWIRRGR
jgi:hypothetical protein